MKNNCNNQSSSEIVSPSTFWNQVRPIFAEYKEPYCLICLVKKGYTLACNYCPVTTQGSCFPQLFKSKDVKNYANLSNAAKAELQLFIDNGFNRAEVKAIIQDAVQFYPQECWWGTACKKQTDNDQKAEKLKMLNKMEKPEIVGKTKEPKEIKTFILASLTRFRMFDVHSYYLVEVCVPKWDKNHLVYKKEYLRPGPGHDEMKSYTEKWVWAHYSLDKYKLWWLD